MEGHNRVKVTEAAGMLGVHRATVLNYITKGILRAYRADEGCLWLIEKVDVENLLKPSTTLEKAGA